jgi:hypothetical protein
MKALGNFGLCAPDGQSNIPAQFTLKNLILLLTFLSYIAVVQFNDGRILGIFNPCSVLVLFLHLTGFI